MKKKLCGTYIRKVALSSLEYHQYKVHNQHIHKKQQEEGNNHQHIKITSPNLMHIIDPIQNILLIVVVLSYQRKSFLPQCLSTVNLNA